MAGCLYLASRLPPPRPPPPGLPMARTSCCVVVMGSSSRAATILQDKGAAQYHERQLRHTVVRVMGCSSHAATIMQLCRRHCVVSNGCSMCIMSWESEACKSSRPAAVTPAGMQSAAAPPLQHWARRRTCEQCPASAALLRTLE